MPSFWLDHSLSQWQSGKEKTLLSGLGLRARDAEPVPGIKGKHRRGSTILGFPDFDIATPPNGWFCPSPHRGRSKNSHLKERHILIRRREVGLDIWKWPRQQSSSRLCRKSCPGGAAQAAFQTAPGQSWCSWGLCASALCNILGSFSSPYRPYGLLPNSRPKPSCISAPLLSSPMARFADQGEKCREVALSMTMRFADLLPVQGPENGGTLWFLRAEAPPCDSACGRMHELNNFMCAYACSHCWPRAPHDAHSTSSISQQQESMFRTPRKKETTTRNNLSTTQPTLKKLCA